MRATVVIPTFNAVELLTEALTALAAQTVPHDVVVVDIPLLSIATKAAMALDAVVVVDTPEEVAVQRLVEHRGFDETDARARIAAQIGRDERRALADFVVDNSGGPEDLDRAVSRLWSWLRSRDT